MIDRKALYLDGGVLLNIFATGRAEEILRASTYRCATVAEIACERFAFVQPTIQTDEDTIRDEVVFNVSTVPSLDIREVDMLKHQVEVVAFAIVFSDVYARLLAVVSAEGAALATDDDCVRRFVRDMLPDIVLVDTPELISNWQRQAAVPDHEVSRAVYKAATLAQFEIAKNHPLRMWWDENLQNAAR